MVHSLIPLIHVSSKRSLGLRDGVRFGINICDISHLELRVYGDIFLDNIREPNPNPLMRNSRRGTNGSVHSRFRPIGDALARTPISTKPSSSSDYSSFPSELPACPWMEVTLSGDSRKKLEENDNVRSERVLYDIVSKSISSAAVDYSSNGP
ncbi:hypothetical protein HID58_046889 [Brassica napus]|uniref:Uncharacterized protein n=1 Tax=Brassica napus TaxID=3708 RepID=A0ABQ8AZ61_BRANA|nr:hypothetical protein HID58_046889 [Brassica napus]